MNSLTGAWLAIGGPENRTSGNSILLWDTTTWRVFRALSEADKYGIVFRTHFSSDDRSLASVGASAEVCVWDVESGARQWTFQGSMFSVFSPDGRTIATVSDDGAHDVQLVDADTGALRFRMAGHVEPVTSASFNGGKHLRLSTSVSFLSVSFL